MPEEGVIVPAGMVPLDNETGKVEAGYEEKYEPVSLLDNFEMYCSREFSMLNPWVLVKTHKEEN